MLKTPSCVKHAFFWSREYFHKAQWQYVAGTAIHKTASVESDLVGADVSSAISGVDAVHHHEGR
jgi:hypothetical protein